MGMEFVGIIGDRGSGKSVLLTKLLADDARAGMPVISNMSLYLPSEYRVEKAQAHEIAQQAIDGKLKGFSIGVDEFGVAADSYDFFEEEPQKMSEMADQLRKDRAICRYTVPRFMRITKRLRDATDGFFYCEDVDAALNSGPKHRETCLGVFRIIQLDSHLTVIRDFYFDGKPWYPFYNTDEKQIRHKRSKKS